MPGVVNQRDVVLLQTVDEQRHRALHMLQGRVFNHQRFKFVFDLGQRFVNGTRVVDGVAERRVGIGVVADDQRHAPLLPGGRQHRPRAFRSGCLHKEIAGARRLREKAEKGSKE